MVFTHLTVMGVTLYFHRSQAHRGVDFHPAICHFFRFWVWLTTAMGTRTWVAVHRKHHSFVETSEDPHSPQVVGLPRVFFAGVWLYRDATKDPETIERFGRGTPDDWLERRLYAAPKIKNIGILSMLLFNAVCFGLIPGLLMWLVQMVWMPFFAVGMVNGVGHYWGYRNFECEDASRNIFPLGLIAGGEELHNNHHAFATSAKLSVKWWEFDIGWAYIKLFEWLGLARVNRSIPVLHCDQSKHTVDSESLAALLGHRMQVMDQYWRVVVLPAFQEGKAKANAKRAQLYHCARKLLIRDEALISAEQKSQLAQLLAADVRLKIIYDAFAQLKAIWFKSGVPQAELLERLKAWCRDAEATGIKGLQDFARQLGTYTMA